MEWVVSLSCTGQHNAGSVFVETCLFWPGDPMTLCKVLSGILSIILRSNTYPIPRFLKFIHCSFIYLHISLILVDFEVGLSAPLDLSLFLCCRGILFLSTGLLSSRATYFVLLPSIRLGEVCEQETSLFNQGTNLVWTLFILGQNGRYVYLEN